jgi:glycosyltransferase involved in cell wall biosynthesis
MIEYFILTFNEEENIAHCVGSLKKIGALKITILDGGSQDSTVLIAKECGCNVLSLPETSISFRRNKAFEICKSEYLCFVDADQRLNSIDVNFESKITEYFLKDPKLAGLQLRLKAAKGMRGYWAKGFAERHNLITGAPGFKIVIGTPSVFRLNLARNAIYEKTLTGPSDDTLFCVRLIDQGLRLISIAESAEEIVRGNFKGTIKKAFWYGLGDAEFIRFNKSTIMRHLFHVLIRGLVIYPSSMFFIKPYMVPFFIIFGLTRVAGLIFGFIVRPDLTNMTS